MSRIEWDADLETGDPVVDHQHRAIHNLFNQLESSSGNAAECMRVLDFLTEHVVVHFATEEELMLRSAYPAELAEAHVAEHHVFTNKVPEQVIAFRSGRLTSTKPLIDFLRDWLTTHVHQSDRRLVDHLRARRITGHLPSDWLAAEDRASA